MKPDPRAAVRTGYRLAVEIDPVIVVDALFGPDVYGSDDRPHVLVDWANALTDMWDEEDAGRAFWAVVRETWVSCDRIPHDSFTCLFNKYRVQWSLTDEINALPDRMTVYRGQSGNERAGLSWTLSRDVAAGFARGHRGIHVPNPVVLKRDISRTDVALAFLDDRGESEVVLWSVTDRIRHRR